MDLLMCALRAHINQTLSENASYESLHWRNFLIRDRTCLFFSIDVNGERFQETMPFGIYLLGICGMIWQYHRIQGIAGFG